jgi:phytoene dehydrogenase-like protein
MRERTYHTVVVGGGMAGLTCAAYLAQQGKKVLIIEKNRECGGLVSTFNRDGYYFEAGIRALENAGIILPMLKELEIELPVVKSPVSVGVGSDILHIRDLNSLTDYQNHLKRLFPESSEEIDQVMKVIRKVMKDMDVLYGIDNPNFKDIMRDKSYLFRELLPWLPRFLMTIGRINRMNMPVEPYLDTFIKNPSLKDIISQHFFKNTPAFFALSYFSLYLDYFYPIGGVGKLASKLEERFLALGGEILRETVIEEVLPASHTVRDRNQVSYSYQHLVWAADLKTFYRITDTGGLSQKIRAEFEKTKALLMTRRGGDSVFTLYLQVDEPPESFRNIASGHFFYSPSKEGLGNTHWTVLADLINNRQGQDKARMLQWLDTYLALNTYEISIPVLKDPGLAPEGKTGLIISILTDFDLFKMIADAGWYKEFVTGVEDRIIQVLAGSVYPMLRDKITGRFSFTPLSYADRVASSEGAITGWSFQEPVPVVHKVQQANKAVVTPIPSIYQAGQWTYSPSGVPISILTGKLAANKILKKSRD